MNIIEYHLKELEIAKDKSDTRHILPEILDQDRIILDIGCGIGQSFVALECTDRLCFGVDINEEVIKYGIEHFGKEIHFILSDAKRIPLPSHMVNLVYCRVSLPYTNIPKTINEIRRLLRKDGRIWMTLHDRETVTKNFQNAVKTLDIKRSIYGLYVLINGYLLKFGGFVLPFINGRYESWQDITAMKELLNRTGFAVSIQKIGRHTVLEGKLDDSI